MDNASSKGGLALSPSSLSLVTCVQVENILVGGKKSHSAMDLVRTPQMRRRATILFYIW